MPTEKNIKTPDELYSHFEAYKDFCKSSPKKENFYSSKLDKEVSVSREVPLTWNGLEIYLRRKGIIAKLDDYQSNKDGRYSEYAAIIRTIGIEIYEDKFAGAAAGIFQHNIIARDLGLADQKTVELKKSLSKEEIKEELEQLGFDAGEIDT